MGATTPGLTLTEGPLMVGVVMVGLLMVGVVMVGPLTLRLVPTLPVLTLALAEPPITPSP